MPLYEYHCSACDLNSEIIVPFAKADKAACQHCGRGDFLIRLLSAPAIKYSYPAGHARSGRGGTGRTQPNA